MDQWYVARGKVKQGPFSRAQLQAAVRTGELQPSDMLLQEGARQWGPAGRVPGLFPAPVISPRQGAPLSAPLPVNPPGGVRVQPPAPPSATSLAPAATAAPRPSRPWGWLAAGAAGLSLLVLVPILMFARVGPRPAGRPPNDPPSQEQAPQEGNAGDRAVAGPGPALPPRNNPVPEGRGTGLSSDDIRLLGLASNWHYVNGKRISGDLERYARHEDLIAREAAKPGKEGQLGRLVLMDYSLAVSNAKNKAHRSQIFTRFRGEQFALAADAALAGLTGKEMLSFDEFRRGPGRSGEEWLDTLRRNEIGRWSLMVVTGQTSVNIANTFETVYAPRLGQGSLGWERMTVAPLRHDQYGPSVGKFIELTYRGDVPLTNVGFVSRLKTRGPSVALTPGQRNALAFNAAFGYDDKNADVAKLFHLQNLVYSMPKGGFVYVPVMKPGDRAQVGLGGAHTDGYVGSSVAVYADQGRLPEQAVDFGEPQHQADPGKDSNPPTPPPISSDAPFFNGKDLTGWQGLPGYWKVADGAIVGAPANGVRAHTFLCSRRTYRDFELKFKVRRKNGIGNSGVQFRSTFANRARFLARGPQIEIDSAAYPTPPGSIVLEGGGGPPVLSNRVAIAKVWKDADFNEMTIRCAGRHVTVTVNGIVAVDADIPSMPREGIIAWQLHGGSRTTASPQEVVFKDIRFTELSPEPVGRPVVVADGPKPDAGGQLLTLEGHTQTLTSVAYSPDGKRLASASFDRTVRVWDAASGKETLTLEGHTAWVMCVAFSPDGKRLASASTDRTVRVWDAASGKETLTLKGHRNAVDSVAFSPDGKRLATGGKDGMVKIWDPATGKEVLAIDTLAPEERGLFGVGRVAFSPDGKRIASAGGVTVKVWDAESGKGILVLLGHFNLVHALAYSPDGKRLASGSRDATVRVWDAASGLQTFLLKGHQSSPVGDVAFSPDGKWLASVSAGMTSVVKVWDAATGKEALSLGELHPVYAVAFSPDSKRLATGHMKTAKIWGATGRKKKL